VLAWSLPFGFAVLWASSYAAAKIGLADITPFAFVALRLALAAIGAALILLVRRTAWDAVAQSWPHLLVGGALVHGLALATTHAVLLSVGATPTALVHAFHPILTALLAVLLLGETFRWWQWAGVALDYAGR
jgi:drug/metabolite transporter (DMT)-like permease